MTKDQYVKDPIHSLALPLWKHKQTAVRKDTIIVSHEKYDKVLYRDFEDNLVLRMKHDLLKLKLKKIPNNYSFATYKDTDIYHLHNLIKECYKGVNISYEEVEHFVKDETFNNLLCVFLYHSKNYRIEKNPVNVNKKDLKKKKEKVLVPIGVVVAHFDKSVKESSIEWLCVTEKYRNKGLAHLLLEEVLLRISNVAEFATVCFPHDNKFALENLFKSVGFEESALWHILKKQ